MTVDQLTHEFAGNSTLVIIDSRTLGTLIREEITVGSVAEIRANKLTKNLLTRKVRRLECGKRMGSPCLEILLADPE